MYTKEQKAEFANQIELHTKRLENETDENVITGINKLIDTHKKQIAGPTKEEPSLIDALQSTIDAHSARLADETDDVVIEGLKKSIADDQEKIASLKGESKKGKKNFLGL